ncbi:MAG: S41 family peptidase [Bacteroidia bacterium]|nr:S41 family peptidase [Bacteroidia bacterium]
MNLPRVFRSRLLALALLAAAAGLTAWTSGDYFQVLRHLEIFARVYTEANEAYVEEPNPTGMMRRAIDSMLMRLDPYTNFYSESLIDASRLINTGQYSGIGGEAGLRGGRLLILELFENGPAQQAGLRVGDEILQIDQEPAAGRSEEQLQNLLQGQKGSKVVLTYRREGLSAPQTVTLARGGTAVQQENVPYAAMASDRIGYILLSGFMENAGREVADALSSLKKAHPDLEGVILDLRGNPGGRLDEAVNICNVFLRPGERIVDMRGRSRESQGIFYTLRQPVDTAIRLAVLVNGRSASASEIVSGSIQDLDRGVIVGRRSFGKGLVQNVRPLSYNTQMKITIARYYTPSGRCIQAIEYGAGAAASERTPESQYRSFRTRNGRLVYDRGGVDPDVLVALPEGEALVEALDAQQIFFDFASAYAARHDTLAPPRTFRISPELYREFTAFAASRGFSYQTEAELQAAAVERALRAEGMPAGSEAALRALQGELARIRSADFDTYREAVQYRLRRELVNRYYFKQGVLEAGFTDDPDLLEAMALLRNPERYQGVLSGK